MKIVVTGANGFTGQHVAQYLASKGFQVFALSRGNARLAAHKLIHYHDCELTNVSSVNSLIMQIEPDWIIHIAAMSKPDECNDDRENCLLHNVQATIHLGEAAIKHHSQFIYFFLLNLINFLLIKQQIFVLNLEVNSHELSL